MVRLGPELLRVRGKVTGETALDAPDEDGGDKEGVEPVGHVPDVEGGAPDGGGLGVVVGLDGVELHGDDGALAEGGAHGGVLGGEPLSALDGLTKHGLRYQ
eukprot:161152_1